MTPAQLAILIGSILILLNFFGCFRPAAFGVALRKFPRSEPCGWVLMLAGTAWFVWIVQTTPLAEFEAFKRYFLIGFAVVGVSSCFFVKDFLAVRGLAIIVLLLAKVVIEKFRWLDTAWRLYPITLAYVWVIAGIFLTVSPWRLRDILEWKLANDDRIRAVCGVRMAMGVLLVILGLMVF
ncbi:MAG: hypothetical protein EXS29_02455 [Pedosphaera sp.]|nr:hypothetical protein [Pedosphaera sp.]MST00159.1 hypothetical protein [Pedosphaera sp.]